MSGMGRNDVGVGSVALECCVASDGSKEPILTDAAGCANVGCGGSALRRMLLTH